MARTGIDIFRETALNFAKYGVSYSERVEKLEKIASCLRNSKLLEQDAQLKQLVEELDTDARR